MKDELTSEEYFGTGAALSQGTLSSPIITRPGLGLETSELDFSSTEPTLIFTASLKNQSGKAFLRKSK